MKSPVRGDRELRPIAPVSIGFLPKGHDMAPRPGQNLPTRQSAARARDRAMSRVRRLTAAITIAATASAVGLGLLVANDTTAHSSTATPSTRTSTSGASDATTPTTTAPTTSGSSSSASSSATDPTTTKPTTVSGQS